MDKTAWGVFDSWKNSPSIEIGIPIQGWQVFPLLFKSFDNIHENEKKEILDLLDTWNERLKTYGGDPSFTNWKMFRPLPLEREEYWSDWLAHLIEQSKTGYFSHALLGPFITREISKAVVKREYKYDGRRADLIISYENGSHAHIEVKTGDANLEKTYETARKMKEAHRSGQTRWADFILLLDDQVGQWLEIKDADADKCSYRTWTNVAVALRRTLLFSNESVLWKSWAYAFLGAIEQKLLGHPFVDNQKKEIRDYYILESLLAVLKEGLKDEE